MKIVKTLAVAMAVGLMACAADDSREDPGTAPEVPVADNVVAPTACGPADSRGCTGGTTPPTYPTPVCTADGVCVCPAGYTFYPFLRTVCLPSKR